MDKPLISVIMAAYNLGSSDAFDMAINSIVQQDMENWELLICDDGSTDGTYERAVEWGRTDKRIRVLRNERNQRAAVARNRCIASARGKFIAIMDADDICDANRLSTQVAFLTENPQYAFVGLRGERFCVTPGDVKKSYWFCPNPEPNDFLMTLPFVHASIMFVASAIKAVGGYEEKISAVRSEDYAMLLKMYSKGFRGANIDTAIYYIREDGKTYQRRKYRYRINEMVVKMYGFAQLGLMPIGVIYALKPLVVGLIPVNVLNHLKGWYYARKQISKSVDTSKRENPAHE